MQYANTEKGPERPFLRRRRTAARRGRVPHGGQRDHPLRRPDLLSTVAERLDERILQQRATFRTRLLGPIFATPTNATAPRSDHPSTVEAALRGVDHALDNLCHTLGLTAA